MDVLPDDVVSIVHKYIHQHNMDIVNKQHTIQTLTLKINIDTLTHDIQFQHFWKCFQCDRWYCGDTGSLEKNHRCYRCWMSSDVNCYGCFMDGVTVEPRFGVCECRIKHANGVFT